MINVEHVAMDFIMEKDRTYSIKEFVIKVIKGDRKKEKLHVLKDIDFQVEKGEVFGIIGRNGAGKSTLLKIISGILKPTKGRVTLKGNVAPMLELGSGMDSNLTGRENVFLNGSILGFSKSFLEERYDDIVDFSELGEFMEVPVRNYSSGMISRLAFSIASMVVPDILIADEILSVGDERFQEKSKKRMVELMKSGTTVLFVSHNIAQVEEICDRVMWLEDGYVKMMGDASEVCQAFQL